ncbi:unnamed protein product [Brassica oleracea]
MKEEEEAKVPTRLDSKVQEEVMEKTVDTKAATQNKLWFPEKTDAESHNSDVEHDEAVTRKQSYFIGMRGLLSCGEKVVSRITTAIVAYGLCGDSVDIDQVLVILILTKDGAVSLSANHLQKLWLSYELTSPLGHLFKPHQVGISSCPNPHSPPRFFFVTLFAIDDSSLFNTPSLPPLFLKQLLQYHTLPLRLPMKELSS